jgi:hypothetical protein
MNTTIREMNEADRIYLNERLDALKNSNMTIDEILLVTAWGSFCGGFVVSLIWTIFCRLIGILPSMAAWQKIPIVYFGVILIFGFFFAYMMWLVVCRDYLHHRSYLARLSRELKHNRVEEYDLIVDDVKCFQEPEHLMKIYLLLMSDGRIRVRYDYDSADLEGRGKSQRTNFSISKEMKIVHFTILGQFRYEFGPTKIRKPRMKELNRPPEKWPADETWLEISWNEADQILST